MFVIGGRAPAASSPDIPACITRDRIELFAAGADPVVCGSTRSECAKHPVAGQGSGNDGSSIQLDAKSTPTHVASPLPVRDPAAAVLHNDQVCLGTACTPIGAKLTTEIAAAQASSKPDDSTAFALSATADLKVVVVRHPNQGGTAWSVHADAPLALDPPPAYRNSNGPPPDVTAVGNVLVADWFDCAGPCHVMQVVGGNGKNVGKPVTGYLQLRWISDSKVFALLENSIVIEGKPPPKDHFRPVRPAHGQAAWRRPDRSGERRQHRAARPRSRRGGGRQRQRSRRADRARRRREPRQAQARRSTRAARLPVAY